MNKPIIIIGNGGHASVLTEILLSQEKNILGFTAPYEAKNQFSLTYLGTDDIIFNYSEDEIELVLGIGTVEQSSIRQNLFRFFSDRQYVFANVIHHSTIIAQSVSLGDGVQIMAGVIIQTNTTLADNTIVNTGAVIDHDCQIGSHIHIAPGTKISGGVKINSCTHIGTGTTIIQGIEIGANCLVGAGSVVVRNVEDGKKVLGVPAKEV